MKRCAKCLTELPESAFGVDRSKRDGLYPSCRECRRAFNRAHQEAQSAARRAKYPERKERVRAANAAYYRANAEKLREYTRQRRKNPETRPVVLASAKKTAAKRREWLLAYFRTYRVKNRARKEAWRRENLERQRQLFQAWQQRNRERVVAYSANRRVQKAQNGGAFTGEEWEAMKARFSYSCLRCGRQEPEIKLHADHIVPVSKGGSGDISNIQPLCGACNSSKHNREATDYRLHGHVPQ